MLPPEVIEQHGDLTDCDNMVGTGPYMLTEWVEGSSITYSKNPDYWDYDEKYPENRLPYIDQINRLIMPEKATQLAALRSGKLDYIGQSGGGQVQAAQVKTLQRTNPEIVVYPWVFRSETSRCIQHAPPVALSRHQGAQGDADGHRPGDHQQHLLWGLWNDETPGDYWRRL